MAEYKLSELNTIDTVRSDDLLHLRVIKRSDMLGDEDRKMTYANFLASFRLERFLQLAGGNMTGNLGIVKLTYGGKDLFYKFLCNAFQITFQDLKLTQTVLD
ncbi:tail fiber protein [Shigella phage vB_SflM_004]|nr:tail fiber protein [Shigella phage vB_SflM_004]